MKKTHFDSSFFEQENDQFSFGDLGNNFPLFFSDKKKKHKHKKHKKDKRERKALKKRLKALELQDEKIVTYLACITQQVQANRSNDSMSFWKQLALTSTPEFFKFLGEVAKSKGSKNNRDDNISPLKITMK